MKKYLFILCGAVCVVGIAIVAAVIFNINRNNLNDRREFSLMFNETFEGQLENGLRYRFYADEFVFSRRQYRRNRNAEPNEIRIAQTPSEAVAIGYRYTGSFPRVGDISAEQIEELIVIVRYCFRTDNWVLRVGHRYPERWAILGFPSTLTINRSNGRMRTWNMI